MKKIVTVVGARPQFVKAAVVSHVLAEQAGVEEVLVHTGQHFDSNMSDVFFEELDIPPPKYNLGIGGNSHAQNTGRAMEGIERILREERADQVLVYGDTDSTLAGALAAAKLCIPVAHVEAGLRSFNRAMPEEINRIVTDHVSSMLFAPSEVARAHLANEGIRGNMVQLVGDVMYDAVLRFTARARGRTDPLSRLGLSPQGYVLMTLHRKENTDNTARLTLILRGIEASGAQVVLPIHPRTRKRIAEFGITLPANIRVIDPVGYLDMQLLANHARLIATDSGGLQKEAYFHQVPCVTLRDETEWVELVALGVNRLVGTNAEAIADAIAQHLFKDVDTTVYGDGKAAERIAATLRC